MRRAHRHQAPARRAAGVGPQPSPQQQPAHAVPHQQRRPAGALPEAPDRGIQCRHMPVQVGPQGLQCDGHGGNRLLPQAPQPGVPDRPVAQIAVHQQHSGPAPGEFGPDIWFGPGTKRLAPGKDPRRRPAFRPPGPPGIAPGWQRVAGACLHRPHQPGGQTQPRSMPAQADCAQDPCQPGPPAAPGGGQRRRPQDQPQQHRQALPARDHPNRERINGDDAAPRPGSPEAQITGRRKLRRTGHCADRWGSAGPAPGRTVVARSMP